MTALNTLPSLIAAKLASPDDADALAAVVARYALSITPDMAALIDRMDPHDPIARQFVPRAEELTDAPGERSDPIGDGAHSPLPGIVHRHRDRVLLLPVKTCPVYCRFCFRRETVGQGETLPPRALDEAIAYIAAHPDIWEVIVTGGDPLIQSARRVADLATRLAAIPHVKAVRWHSRVPVVDPARIDAACVAALAQPGAVTYLALHANHPREITKAARGAVARLIDAGIMVVSQSVLLRGVNDDVDTLACLMRTFVENRIKPYYLHHPDLAPGTAHFRLTIAEGQALMRGLRAKVSGLCMPSYVLDIPGGHAKVPLGEGDVEPSGEGWRIRDRDGVWHDYP